MFFEGDKPFAEGVKKLSDISSWVAYENDNKNGNMKVLLFLLSFLTFSCSSKEKRTEITEQNKVQADLSTNEETEIINSELTSEETQDSLHNILLKSKPNENLKSSLLQELYIRGLVNQENDQIYFELPFNLHGLDCGAPDCYSTDISFKIVSVEPIEFPEYIDFKLNEHGCVDQERSINSIFKLKEKSNEYVNYFSEELKSNLIIKNKELYYYPHLNANYISVATIEKMFENNEFEDAEIAPYQSTVMISNEYEHFIGD